MQLSLTSINYERLARFIPTLPTFTSLLLMLSLPLSMLSGAGLAPLFIILAIWPCVEAFRKSGSAGLFYGTRLHELLIIFFAFSAASLAWSPDAWGGFTLLLRLWFMATFTFAILNVMRSLSTNEKEYLGATLVIGFNLALIIAALDLMYNGMVTETFRRWIGSDPRLFRSVYLSRGVVFVSLCVWPCIGFLIKSGRSWFAVPMALSTALILWKTDNDAAVMALILGALAMGFTYTMERGAILIALLVMLAGSVLMPWAAIKVDPKEIEETYTAMPSSATHRVHIWHHVAEKALERKELGWGFDASRHISEQQRTDKKLHWKDKLPLHPHNATLQLWLELGYAGLGLFTFGWLVIWGRIFMLKNDIDMATAAAVATGFYSISQVGFGFWQSWWLSAGLLALSATVGLRGYSFKKQPETEA